MSRESLAKLRSPALQAVAAEGSPQRQVVVVKVRMQDDARLTFKRLETGRVQPSGFEFGKDADDDPLAAATHAIEAAAGTQALNAFRSSGAVIIEVDGAQLRRIAALPQVEQIYPNDPR